MSQSGNTRNRLISIKAVTPVKRYISWGPDSFSQGTDAILNDPKCAEKILVIKEHTNFCLYGA